MSVSNHAMQDARSRLHERPERDTGLWLLIVGAAATLGVGFAFRGEHWVVPERGLGYGLGVAGLGAMTALLGYSVRKRLRALRRWGAIGSWFRIHMFLGIAGPVAILLHCNFRLGSTNANAALVSALLVSASGVLGRLLYVRIHAGLFGRRLNLVELRKTIAERKSDLATPGGPARPIALEAVDRFEQRALEPRGLIGSTIRLFGLPFARGRALREAVPAGGAPAGDEAAARVAAYLDAVSRASAFTACERLFALWHVVHLPLCLLLFLAAAVHVVVVHVY